jgi:hypothetical protein
MEPAMRRLAERRIEDAMREGKFDNLAGAGKPLDLEPMPADENARMTWWMLRLLKNNNFTPDEVRWRRQIEKMKEELAAAMTQHRVDTLVRAINAMVRQVNTLGTNAINIAVSPVSLEEERLRLRERLAHRAGREERAAARAARPRHAPPEAGESTRACDNDQCRGDNPPAAQFCRRCGKVLA